MSGRPERAPSIGAELSAALASASGFFAVSRELRIARAPGRLDVMGGFADYSGSLTLEMPIREAAFVAVQTSEEPSVRVQSTSSGADQGRTRSAEFPLAELARAAESYAALREYFQRDRETAWAAYVLGALGALAVERGREPRSGLRILVGSSVPEGKGVSSSAALEVASFYALSAAEQLAVDPHEAALICQRVENLVVGAPCGVMDQMTSSCGVEGQLLALLCQPAELEGCFAVPSGFAFWGIDSGLRHQVSGDDYGSVRVAAFMGYRLIAAARGLPAAVVGPGRVGVRDDVYRGYLANVTPAELEREYAELLPERMDGADFLRRFHGIPDRITSVRPGASYRVRAATAHPIHENQRAREFLALMRQAPSSAAELDAQGARLGELMYAAHASYSECGLGSTGTDRIVGLVRRRGAASGLYGAKITGGGSGGTVVVLGRSSAAEAVREVAADYARETGHSPHLFSGSSPGASAFGARRARFSNGSWHMTADSAGSQQ
jgi:galactokinase